MFNKKPGSGSGIKRKVGVPPNPVRKKIIMDPQHRSVGQGEGSGARLLGTSILY
jgi:hypothetical protein